MRITDMFRIPVGEKVTEKALRKVLISSICSILLCMTCLVSATWAWFAVSIENTDNMIRIGKPEVQLTVDGAAYEAGMPLGNAEHTVNITHGNREDDFQKKSTLYVTLTVQTQSGTKKVYAVLNEENGYSTQLKLQNATTSSCSFGWTVSWFAPAQADELTGNTIAIEQATPTQSEDPTATTGTPQATTTPATETTTVPATEAPTEATTTPATEAPTEATTVPATEAPTEATTTPVTEATTVPTTDEVTE